MDHIATFLFHTGQNRHFLFIITTTNIGNVRLDEELNVGYIHIDRQSTEARRITSLEKWTWQLCRELYNLLVSNAR